MPEANRSVKAKWDKKTRQHLMELSFAGGMDLTGLDGEGYGGCRYRNT